MATKEELKEEEIAAVMAYQRLFNSPDGEFVLNHLKSIFYDRTSIVPGDPYATHAKEGAREVILYIKQTIELGG